MILRPKTGNHLEVAGEGGGVAAAKLRMGPVMMTDQAELLL